MTVKGSTLKWIAIVTMFIDHLAAVVLMPAWGIAGPLRLAEAWALGNGALLTFVMRQIGRLAFPIFCFLLVEGLTHTHSRALYLRNLLLLAVVSEIPFDLCISGRAVYGVHQSTICTLVLGFLACWGMDWLEDHTTPTYLPIKKSALLGVLMVLAWLFKTDYAAFGVVLIVLLYILRSNRTEQCLLGGIVCLFGETAAALAFLPIYLYNRERGKQLKLLFYAFYPIHLLVLYFTRLLWLGW